VKTASNKIVQHSLAIYPYKNDWPGDVPFCTKIWPKLTHPFQNANFQSIFARSTSAVSLSEKYQLPLIGSSVHYALSNDPEIRGTVYVALKPFKWGWKTQSGRFSFN